MKTLAHRNTDVIFPSLFQSLFGEATHPEYGLNIPAANIKENDHSFSIEVAVPGVNKEDIKINVHEGLLTISAEKQKEEKSEEFRRVEFTYENFKRSFRLPKTVNLDKIEASQNNGILLITLPKVAEAEPKLIQIV